MKFVSYAAFLITFGLAVQSFAADVQIDQINKKFKPGIISINVGDTLVFRNSETKRRRHNVYSRTPGFEYVKIKSQNQGQSNIIRITNAGTFEVLCAFHPRMKLQITVNK